MSARLELDDLPPRYRAQAEAQIAARQRGKRTHTQPMAEAASAAGRLNKTFDSYGVCVLHRHNLARHSVRQDRVSRTAPEVDAAARGRILCSETPGGALHGRL